MNSSHEKLAAEFRKISRQVKDALRESNEKANRRGVLFSGMPIALKVEATGELLENTLKRLAQIYLRKSELAEVEKFLDQQQEVILQSIKANDPKADHSPVVIERMDEVKGVVRSAHHQARRLSKVEWIKFWIPISISALALIVSVLAIVQGGDK